MQVFLIITRANEGFKLNFINLASYFLLDDESYCVIIKISLRRHQIEKDTYAKEPFKKEAKAWFQAENEER